LPTDTYFDRAFLQQNPVVRGLFLQNRLLLLGSFQVQICCRYFSRALFAKETLLYRALFQNTHIFAASSYRRVFLQTRPVFIGIFLQQSPSLIDLFAKRRSVTGISIVLCLQNWPFFDRALFQQTPIFIGLFSNRQLFS